jgi:AraC-like DNA-binding protein
MYFEAWNAALRQTCGNFFGIPNRGQNIIDGHFRPRDLAGLRAVDIACNINRIDRPIEGVRRDGKEYFFLLAQIAGQINIQQAGEQTILTPGKLYLLDSTCPASIGFDDKFVRYVAVHIPRALLLLDASADLEIGAARFANEAAITRLYRLLMTWSGTQHGGDSDFLLDLTRATFSPGDAVRPAHFMRSQRSRYKLAIREIESSLNSPDLSLPWLARRMGISMRQLDRDFEANGTSYVQTVRSKRLKLAMEFMDVAQGSGKTARICDVAQDAGFRDLSNFNHAFKAEYGFTPRDYVKGRCQNLTS